MRVTNNMMANRMLTTLNYNLSKMSEIQNQLATGKKITLPSDNPNVAAKALKFRSDVSEIAQYKSNVEDALSWTDITDSTLGTIGDVIHTGRDLAVQASTGTNTDSDRKKIKEQVNQLFNELIELSNTTYAGRHIFSGFKTDQPLVLEEDKVFNYTDAPAITDGTNFRLKHDNITSVTDIKADLGAGVVTLNVVSGAPMVSGDVHVDQATGMLTFFAGDTVSNVTASYTLNRVKGEYNPDVYNYSNMTQTQPMENEDIKFEVGIGDKINVNVIGTKVFGLGIGASSMGSNISNFKDFVDALNSDDQAGIEKAISDMDSFIDSILGQRADVGARSNRLELTDNRLSNDYNNFTDLMSQNEDVDVAKAILDLQMYENVYKASLDTGARIIQPTLVDFIR